MRPRNSWMAFVGVALGALALVVALEGRFDGFKHGSRQHGWQEQTRGNVAPAAQLAQRDSQDEQVGTSDAGDQEVRGIALLLATSGTRLIFRLSLSRMVNVARKVSLAGSNDTAPVASRTPSNRWAGSNMSSRAALLCWRF